MNTILQSFSYSLEYLRDLIADVDPSTLCAQPDGVMNHPLWTVGHLSFALNMLGGVIGADSPEPETWSRLFGPGSVPTSESTIYPPIEEMVARLLDVQQQITAAVSRLDDAQLEAPFPDESFLDVFPTVRHALTQVLVGHTAFHVGQVAVWRRAMRLAPMLRSYE